MSANENTGEPTLTRELRSSVAWLDVSAALRTVRAEAWIVVWVTRDDTGMRYWRGIAADNNDPTHDEMWSARRCDALRYASFEAALSDPDLVDFWEAGDVEAEREARDEEEVRRGGQ